METLTKQKAKNKDICDTIEQSSIKVRNEIKQVIKDTNENAIKISYAQTLKNNKLPDLSKKMFP